MSNNNDVYRSRPGSSGRHDAEDYHPHRSSHVTDAEVHSEFQNGGHFDSGHHNNSYHNSSNHIGSPNGRDLGARPPFESQDKSLRSLSQSGQDNRNRGAGHPPFESPDRSLRSSQGAFGHRNSGSRPQGGSGDGSLRSSRPGVGERGISGKTTNTYPQDENFLFLQKQGFPRGLAQGLIENAISHPIRFWVVDNSGSMMATDGQTCMLGAKAGAAQNMIQVVQTTRWVELQESVAYHAQLSATLKSSTIFQFLNDPGPLEAPQEFSINQHGSENVNLSEDVEIAHSIIRRVKPSGSTPLTARILEIRERIQEVAKHLRQRGQHAVIIIATDGLPTNEYGDQDEATMGEFIQTLKSLQSLPIWIVVRLCTNESEVVNFYNTLDSKLELPIDVLDDFFSEAREVHKANSWLNYSLHIHRCREFGCHNRIFDLLDERPLTKDELLEFLMMMFGEAPFQGVPSMHSNWRGFFAVLSEVVAGERKQWNPITKKVAPWIDLAKLDNCYGKKRFRLCGC